MLQHAWDKKAFSLPSNSSSCNSFNDIHLIFFASFVFLNNSPLALQMNVCTPLWDMYPGYFDYMKRNII